MDTKDEIILAKDRSFNARHDGRCTACGCDFEAGEMITMVEGQAVHATDHCLEIAFDA